MGKRSAEMRRKRLGEKKFKAQMKKASLVAKKQRAKKAKKK